MFFKSSRDVNVGDISMYLVLKLQNLPSYSPLTDDFVDFPFVKTMVARRHQKSHKMTFL